MSDEKSASSPVIIEHNQKLLSGKQVADPFTNNFQKVSDVEVPEDRRKEVRETQKQFQEMDPQDDVITIPCTSQELEEAIKLLLPGPDGVTNELIQHLGPSAKETLLKICNASWKNSSVPQSWSEATMIPIHKNGNDRSKADRYRPTSLTRCVNTLVERLINTRLTWYQEKQQIITPQQDGFIQNRSTENQVTYIAQEIEDVLQDKKHTLTVWIDLENAFDREWRDGLKLKMHQCEIYGLIYR